MHRQTMHRQTLLEAGACGAALLLAAPRPVAAVRTLTAPGPAQAATDPLVATVALAAWCLVLWLLVTALLTAGSRLSGAWGRGCSALLRGVAPAAVRRAVALALGVGIVLGAAGPARAEPAPAPPSADSALGTGSLDWPTLPAAPASTTPTSPPSTAPPAGTVVVAPGDSLWRIAAEHLPPRASNAAIAAAWPAWWSANRTLLGDDPDLIHPGDHLAVPAAPAPHLELP